MKSILLTAKDYQKGFKAGLLFTGFDEDGIVWLGNNKSWDLYDESE